MVEQLSRDLDTLGLRAVGYLAMDRLVEGVRDELLLLRREIDR